MGLSIYHVFKGHLPSKMKTTLLIYLILIHTFIGVTLVKTDIISFFQAKLGLETARSTKEMHHHYSTMLSFHLRVDKNILDNSVIFIGDSIIQGLAVSAVSPHSVNFGIGHDTTVGVLERIPYYESLTRSKTIVIAIGVNDLKKRENNEIIQNYLKIIDTLPSTVPVLFSAVLPLDEIASKRIGINNRIREINDSLDSICATRNRLHFLNISPFVTGSNGDLLPKYHIGDGLHLSTQGNNIWISNLKKSIFEITSNTAGLSE